jgi:site-specific DNA-methyltransferase (adenine-specific)
MIDLQHGDCLELMKSIPDGSIDMILCDLPYGGKTTWNKWDNRLPFDELWQQYKRLIKPNGAVVLTATQPFTSLLVTSNIEMYRCSYVWVKDNATNFANAKNQPMRRTEDVVIFSKGGMCPQAKVKCTYNPQGLKPLGAIKSRGGVGDNYASTLKTKNWQEYTGYPDNILHYGYDKKRYHPTQKPTALMEYLVKTYSNEGETVLDNCMGSGTTGVACLNTNRNFIGMEKDDKYFEIACERIKNHERW